MCVECRLTNREDKIFHTTCTSNVGPQAERKTCKHSSKVRSALQGVLQIKTEHNLGGITRHTYYFISPGCRM